MTKTPDYISWNDADVKRACAAVEGCTDGKLLQSIDGQTYILQIYVLQIW